MGFTLLNNAAVKEIASDIIRENIVQDVVVIPGKGADFSYATDVEGNSIDVQRTKLSTRMGRKIGATTNGGFVNSQTNTIESDIVSIPLTYTYDACTNVPQNALRMNGTGKLLESILKNTTKEIARTINSCYFAQIITDCLNAAISATSAAGNITYSISNKYVSAASADTAAGAMAAFYAAASNLSEGDEANGFDLFPTTNTECFMRGKFRYLLQNNAGVFAGNFIGQQMVSSGSFSAFDAEYTPDLIRGYVGELNGAVVYEIGNLFDLAEDWLGQLTLADNSQTVIDAGSLANLNAVYVCGLGIAGGVDRSSEVKVVDLQGGQGVQVQPLVRCGFATFSPKAVQLITANAGLTASKFVTYTGAGSVATETKKLSVYAPGNQG